MHKGIDLFCGAGGTTEGAHQSGQVAVKVAINHWRPAVSSHRANHPDVRHICAEIDKVDPVEFVGQGINVLLASPECIFHSNARGGKPVDDRGRYQREQHDLPGGRGLPSARAILRPGKQAGASQPVKGGGCAGRASLGGPVSFPPVRRKTACGQPF